MIDAEIQQKIDDAVAEITAKFDAEKAAALEALKAEYEAKLAESAKVTSIEVIGTIKVKFGLPA